MAEAAFTSGPTVADLLRERRWRRLLPGFTALAASLGVALPVLATADELDEQYRALCGEQPDRSSRS